MRWNALPGRVGNTVSDVLFAGIEHGAGRADITRRPE